jgi:hypothetical protein
MSVTNRKGTTMTSPIRLRTLGSRTLALAFSLAALFTNLLACKDDAKPIEQPVVIKAIGLKGTSTQTANVRINQQADQDSVSDQSWQAGFQLNGQVGPNSLPNDDGTAQSVALDVKGTHVSDGEADRTRVTLSIEPGSAAK